jgi:predicted permease
VTVEGARAGLEPVYARVREEVASGMSRPEQRQDVLESRLGVLPASGGSSRFRDNLRAPLVMLMGMVGLVLAVACANVATLMLARSASRRRETAVCLAIGAGRFRIIRQSMIEALLLAIVGGVSGLLLTTWGTSVLVALVSGVLPISLDVALDARVLAFAILLSCSTALLCGALPAVRAARLDPLRAIAATPGTERATGRIPLLRLLVVAQIAVSLVLLIAAGLFVRSLLRLGDVNTGFDPEGVLVFRVTPPASDPPMSIDEVRALYRRLLGRAESVPGVEAASGSSVSLFTNATWGNAIEVEGYVPPSGVTPRTFANLITPRYFDVMRIAVTRGRGFTDADREGAPRTIVVNQTFARQFFGDADPVGKHVGLCDSDPCAVSRTDMREIVGVVADLKYVDLREERRSMLYVPFGQYADPHLHEIEVRTAGAPAAVAEALHRELAGADSRIGIAAVAELRDQLDGSLVAERLLARLSATFGLLALALAAVGLYGVVAYATTRRTPEIGTRMALGASRGEMRRLVLRDTLRLVVLGTLCGLPLALAASRLLGSQLYEVRPYDPFVVGISVMTLLLAAFLAGYLPARRAARVDPVVALRMQ